MIITRSSSVAEYKPEAVNALDRMRDVLATPDCRAAFAHSPHAALCLAAIAAETPADAFVGLALVPERSETFFGFAVTADCLSMISLLLK
ncbi:MAG: hypothetical protein NUV75_04600 [Gallionella sp.]|nr:hypothetical protein [Gallionella sp.]